MEKLTLFDVNIKVNVQKLAGICGYELPQQICKISCKKSTEIKIFQKVFFWWGATFLKHPVGKCLYAFQVCWLVHRGKHCCLSVSP